MTNHFTLLMSVLVREASVNTFSGNGNRFPKVNDFERRYSIVNLSLRIGFGFTLKGKADFALYKFAAGTSETFDPYYGVGGYDGDGDIFKSENIDALQNYIHHCTMDNGVHMMMADGVSDLRRVKVLIWRWFLGLFGRRTRKYSRNS